VRTSLGTGRKAILIAALAAVVGGAGVAAITTVSPPPARAAVAAAAPVEDEGVDCPVSLPGSSPANSRLPDPFQKLNGSRITAKSDWRCRREEIKKLAERSVYGAKPGKPASVTGTVSSTSITVNVSDQGRSSSFSASVQLPSGSGPFPAVVVVGGFGADTATIRAAGVAVINYDPMVVGREGTPRNNKQGAFYSIYGASSSTGLLMAWAWGVSRMIDVIQQSDGRIIKSDALGVTGCSRFGKGAFTVGVFDQRIALTMPIESGSAGVPILRGIPGESGAQPLSSAFSEQPWLGDAFSSFTGSPNNLPVDQHEMVAMVAPRGLFIMENPHIDWLAARSGSVSALGGAEVYNALGAGGNITYWSDVQDGTHCAVRPEWRAPLQQNLQKFLLKTGASAGVFRISSLKAGNLSQWRDWTTPVLSDGPPTTTTTTTTTGPPPAPGGCTIRDDMNAWNTGFTSNLTITNNSTTAINEWSLVFTLPAGQVITSTWNATYTPASGQVTATNVGFNAAVDANGGTVSGFGFQATHTGNMTRPTSFTLNGTSCTVAGAS
jgi:hypothetical protein